MCKREDYLSTPSIPHTLPFLASSPRSPPAVVHSLTAFRHRHCSAARPASPGQRLQCDAAPPPPVLSGHYNSLAARRVVVERRGASARRQPCCRLPAPGARTARPEGRTEGPKHRRGREGRVPRVGDRLGVGGVSAGIGQVGDVFRVTEQCPTLWRPTPSSRRR